MAALGLILLQLKWVVLQVFGSLIIAAGMSPVVRRATDPARGHIFGWRPPAALVVVVIYVVAAVVILGAGTILVGAAVDGLTTLAERAPQYAAEIRAWLDSLQQTYPVLAPLHVADLFGGVNNIATQIAGLLGQIASAATILLNVFGGLVNVLFILFMALYITVDGERIRDYALVFLPLSRQAQGRLLVTNISSRLGHWVVGQLLLSLIIGIVAGIGLGLIGVPGAAFLGVIWMIAEFIPGIGPFISAVPSIVLGFLAGPTTGVLAAIFSFTWSQIESNVVTPRLMGRAVELNPLMVLLALLVGNELLGLAGALLAIPAAAAIGVVVDELRRERVDSIRRQLAAQPNVSEAHLEAGPPTTAVVVSAADPLATPN